MDKHIPFSAVHAPQRVTYPDEGSSLEWDSPENCQKVEYLIIADFESFLIPENN